ncbi:hypothetical protein GTP58_20255 [Duganella sp. CY15W]|uniref:hypothetical protein n=1 Tax=Duganella sp. CY15W TaxID=2692172 RepID=UPI00136DB037|nr:hypothetical protein [Duganella sp. CY15W]MYM30669.1 hypothetical protein [Duganella sp. CY15W]
MKGIIIALLGVLTAIFTNVEKINDVIVSYITKSEPLIQEKWQGVAREYVAQKGREVISSEIVSFKLSNGNLVGSVTNTQEQVRSWDILGRKTKNGDDDEYLILSYVGTNPGRRSAGAYVLKYKKAKDAYFGYWLGYDPEQRQMVSFPYILSKKDAADIEKEYKEFLESRSPNSIQPCVPDCDSKQEYLSR